MNPKEDYHIGHNYPELTSTEENHTFRKCHKAWEVLHAKEICNAPPWITLSVQQVRLPNGRVVDDYHQIKLLECVVVFASTKDGRIIMERQYKHGVGEVTLTLPSGLVEDGEKPLVAAQRELIEETGHKSTSWESLGSFAMHGNYGCGRAHLFKASDAKRFTEPKSGDLEDMEIVLMTLDEIARAFRGGDIGLLGTMATIAVATNPLFAFSHADSNESSKS